MSRTARLVTGFVALVALLGAGALWLTSRSDDASLDTSVAVADAMSRDTTGYRRADRVRDFVFPDDHGPHPGYKTEWWYLTGSLDAQTPDGTPRRFGFQWTVFRIALSPPSQGKAVQAGLAAPSDSAQGRSDWATNDLFMAHAALSDVTAQRHVEAERYSRGGAGLAGAQAAPFRVWLEDWTLEQADRASGTAFPARVRASEGGVGFDLTLTPAKPIVFQGDRGYSQKGPAPGNASYYYSLTRLDTDGHVVVEGDSLAVTGTSWMDHEWSTSALGPEQIGWDWFSLQLDDGRDLMVFQLRRSDGERSPFNDGTLVAPDGSTTPLDAGDLRFDVVDTWTTPDGERTYPVAWRIRVPAHDLDLRVEAAFPDQEMDLSVRYWEGAVDVSGSATGRGYLEMTGYGDTPASPTS